MANSVAVQVFIDDHHKKCVAALQQIVQLADTGSELHKQRFQPNGESDGIPVSWRVVEAMREIASDAIGGVLEKQQMTPYCESDGQPEWCKKLVEAGWRFRYDPATCFVSAEHPRGGKQSIAEVPVRTTLGEFDPDEFGKQLAATLNGNNT